MIKSIQNEYTPDIVTPPGDTLQEIIDSMGMKKAELADRIGKTPKFINDIINHSAAITPTTASQCEKEKEADRFAANFLISLNAWQKFVSTADYKSETTVEEFAKKQQISPAIVVGRLQHENLIVHNRLNDLRRRFEIKKSS